MRSNGIGILALQETHLTDPHVLQLHSLFGKRLRIFHSSDPEEPNARGVALVLNHEKINPETVSQHIIVPGRALLSCIPWSNSQNINILTIYAPNQTNKNRDFWETLKNKWENSNLPIPDIMLGDFNLVEDALDRLPSHPDNEGAVETLREFKTSMRLNDGWRATYPTTKSYTFLQKSTGSQSRIDRIYLSEAYMTNSSEWLKSTVGLLTDHNMVSVHISNLNTPFIGKGRWSLPLHLLKDKPLMEQIEKMGIELVDQMERSKFNCPADLNPQTLFKNFKDTITHKCRDHAKVKIPIMDKKIRELQSSLDLTLNNPNLPENERALAGAIIQERICTLEQKRHSKARLSTAARNRLEGETISKYWSQLNKAKTPRDTITALKKPNTNPPLYEKRSENMTKLARDYHDNLQTEEINLPEAQKREILEEVLGNINKEASPAQCTNLAEFLTKADIKDAIKDSPNGKAAGINGLPTELWKHLMLLHQKKSSTGKPTFDILKALQYVYNDIERHGIVPDSEFAMGWMCPIFKKKDKTEIANYHPITVLNTDYKIFTKALAMKLAKVAPSIIHENQAGFIPGRSIFDQVKLSKLMIDYAEATEINGMIVSLDQEKAYDKVSHEYL